MIRDRFKQTRRADGLASRRDIASPGPTIVEKLVVAAAAFVVAGAVTFIVTHRILNG